METGRNYLTKKQRTRVRRVINNFMGPINHLSRDGLDKIFADEFESTGKLRDILREKAQKLGYDPEEDLPDVNPESYYE